MTRVPGRLNAGLCHPRVRGPGIAILSRCLRGTCSMPSPARVQGGWVDGRREWLVRGWGQASLAPWDLSSHAGQEDGARANTDLGGQDVGGEGRGIGAGAAGVWGDGPERRVPLVEGGRRVQPRVHMCAEVRVCMCVSTGVRRAQLTQCTRLPPRKRLVLQEADRL